MKALHSSKVVLPGGIREAWVIINEAIIEDVLIETPATHSFEVIELGDNILMPGVIDPHVHINEPGRTEWEGFDSATRAAIAGGITTLVDMPLNSSPVTVTATCFDEKLDATKNKLHTNVGFWGGCLAV